MLPNTPAQPQDVAGDYTFQNWAQHSCINAGCAPANYREGPETKAHFGEDMRQNCLWNAETETFYTPPKPPILFTAIAHPKVTQLSLMADLR